jgi:transposase-like protein
MDSGAGIEMRQSTYLNNMVEQDHRAIKRRVRPMMGFKSFRCARAILASFETMHMIRKGHLESAKVHSPSAPEQVYSPAH